MKYVINHKLYIEIYRYKNKHEPMLTNRPTQLLVLCDTVIVLPTACLDPLHLLQHLLHRGAPLLLLSPGGHDGLPRPRLPDLARSLALQDGLGLRLVRWEGLVVDALQQCAHLGGLAGTGQVGEDVVVVLALRLGDGMHHAPTLTHAVRQQRLGCVGQAILQRVAPSLLVEVAHQLQRQQVGELATSGRAVRHLPHAMR